MQPRCPVFAPDLSRRCSHGNRWESTRRAKRELTENRARKGKWSDRILGSARIQAIQRGDLPDGVFLYVEVFDFQI